MPRPPAGVDPYQWTLDLPPGKHCSVGWSNNMVVNADGTQMYGGRPNEDKFFTCSSHEDKIQVYLVLDGHDGIRACEFAQKHLPSVLLRCDINERDENTIITAVKSAFMRTERDFFVRIDPQITRKLTLQIEINQKARNSQEAVSLFPGQVQEIQRLDDQIKGGTTAVMAVVINNKLYVANCGDSRAVLCSEDTEGRLIVQQISVDHNTQNERELQRLAECGLDPHTLRKNKRLGTQQNTRSIGDYSIKGGYTDVDVIRHASREPGTADPYLAAPVDLKHFRGFLILMTDGLYEAYEAWTRRPRLVNDDIGHLVAKEMRECSEFELVGQNVVEKVKHVFQRSCQNENRLGRLDDITLIVRNFGYPPHLTHSQSYPSGIGSKPPHSVQPIPPSAPVQSNTGVSAATNIYFPPAGSGTRLPFYSNIPSVTSHVNRVVPPQPNDFRRVPSGNTVGGDDPRQSPFLNNAQSGSGFQTQVTHGGGQFIPEPESIGSPPQSYAQQQQPSGYSNDPLYPQNQKYVNTNDWTGVYPSHGPASNAQMSQFTSQPPLPSVTVPHPTALRDRQQSYPVVSQQNETTPYNYHGHSGNWTGPLTVDSNYENTVPSDTLGFQSQRTDSVSPRSSLYENVTLKPSPDPKRYSDSLLEEKTRFMNLGGSPVQEGAVVAERRKSDLDSAPPPSRTNYQEPSNSSKDRQFSQTGLAPVADQQTTPKLSRRDSSIETQNTDEENLELYGWTGKESQPSSLVDTQPRTLTAGDVGPQEVQLYDTLKEDHGPSLDKLTPSSSPKNATSPNVQRKVKPEVDEANEDEEGIMTIEMSGDIGDSEVSENEEEDTDGSVKSYVKFASNFPHDLSWDDIKIQ